MTMTELLVDDHQPEAALEAVAELNASGRATSTRCNGRMKAHQQAKNWPEVLRLVRSLDKHKALHPALSARLRELAYDALLSDSAHDAESILRVWADDAGGRPRQALHRRARGRGVQCARPA